MSDNTHEFFMRKALEQATVALEQDEVPVGCVIVHNDPQGERKIIGAGYNKTNLYRNGTKHAEIVTIDHMILEQRLHKDIFREYVTCEPCIMCAAALGKVGIRSVFFGCHNERFGGNGSILSLHEGPYHSYAVTSGLLLNEAINLFKQFYATENKNAPDDKRKRKRGVECAESSS